MPTRSGAKSVSRTPIAIFVFGVVGLLVVTQLLRPKMIRTPRFSRVSSVSAVTPAQTDDELKAWRASEQAALEDQQGKEPQKRKETKEQLKADERRAADADSQVKSSQDDLAQLGTLSPAAMRNPEHSQLFIDANRLARLIMQVVLSTALLIATLYVILSKKYAARDKHWAYATIGLVVGFWLKA